MSTKTLNFGKPAKVVAYEMALALATKKADTPSELLSLTESLFKEFLPIVEELQEKESDIKAREYSKILDNWND